MTDIVDAATRSRMMSGIRGKDTKIELLIRRGLHARGFRYRLHERALPGRPDLSFSSRKAAILIHGCYWHGHDCHLFKLPSSNTEFWFSKIQANRARDVKSIAALHELGWRVGVIWECALRGRADEEVALILNTVECWLRNGCGDLELREPLTS